MIDPGALQSGTQDVGPLQSTVVIGVTVAPSNGSVLLTGHAPSILFGIVASPGQGSLLITGHVPSVVIGIKVSPDHGAILGLGHVPSVIIGVIVAPDPGSLLVTGHDPTDVAIGIMATPDPGVILTLGYAPTVSIYSTAVDSATGTLQITGYAPSSIAVWNGLLATPATGSIKLTGHNPTIALFEPIVYPDTGTLHVTGFVPSVTFWRGMTVHPTAAGVPFGSLRIKGYAATVTEFGTDLVVYIDGVDRTSYVVVNGSGVGTKAQQFQIQSQTLGRWTATFDLFDDTGTFAPSLGHTVRVTDYARTLFSGVFSQIVTERLLSTEQATCYHATALDRSSLCDHRLVGKVYKQADWADASDVVNDIVAKFLNGEGIIAYSIPPMGALNADLTFTYCTVTNALDQIATMTGTTWWVDSGFLDYTSPVSGSNLYFSCFDSLPAAPFNLTENSHNWRNLCVTNTTANYYNRMYAVGNRFVPPKGGPGDQNVTRETFILGDDEPGVTLAYANGVLFLAQIWTSKPLGTVVSMTLNGVPQTVYDFITPPGYTGQTSSGPNDALWFFGAGESVLQWAGGGNPSPLGKTAVIEYAVYDPAATTNPLTSVSLAQTPDPPALSRLPGTLGSGYFEGTISVDDFLTLDDLNSAAKAEVNKIGGLPYIVGYESDTPGLAPGQVQRVTLPLGGIPSPLDIALGETYKDILITQVSGVYFAADLGTAQGGLSDSGHFRWTVEGISNMDPGNLWVKWYERVIRRTQNSLPLPDYEECTFVLGAGSNVSTGVSITNPYICKRSGALFEVLFAASVPPTKLLTLIITRGGSTLVSVVVPTDLAANALQTWTISPQIVITKGDVLNVNAVYTGTGDPAQGVTLVARWQVPSSNL